MSMFRNILIDKALNQFDYSLLTFSTREGIPNSHISSNITQYPNKFNFLYLKIIDNKTSTIEYLSKIKVIKSPDDYTVIMCGEYIIEIDTPTINTETYINEIYFSRASNDILVCPKNLDTNKILIVQIITQKNNIIYENDITLIED